MSDDLKCILQSHPFTSRSCSLVAGRFSVHHLRLGRGAIIHKVGASVKTRAASHEVGTPAPFIHTDAHRYTHMVRNRHTQPHTCNISARKPRVTQQQCCVCGPVSFKAPHKNHRRQLTYCVCVCVYEAALDSCRMWNFYCFQGNNISVSFIFQITLF